MMPRPKCLSKQTQCKDSRWRPELHAIYRRRQCRKCGHLWTTFEKREEASMKLDLRRFVKLVDEMEGKMAEAVKELREELR